MPQESARPSPASSLEEARIVLGIFEAVEAGRLHSQRHLSAELGIALGLANAYVKRLVRKGLMKVSEVPARRYAYYLTPTGFAEKSRLTAEYLSYSFGFFRQARIDCALVFDEARRRGWSRVVLVGQSEIAEVAALCALDSDINVAAIVEPGANRSRFVGVPVQARFDLLPSEVDGAIICAIRETQSVVAATVAAFGATRVLAPGLLRQDLAKGSTGPALVSEDGAPHV